MAQEENQDRDEQDQGDSRQELNTDLYEAEREAGILDNMNGGGE